VNGDRNYGGWVISGVARPLARQLGLGVLAYLSFGATLAYLVLAGLVTNGTLAGWDLALTREVIAWQWPLLDLSAELLNLIGRADLVLGATLLAAALAARRGRRGLALALLLLLPLSAVELASKHVLPVPEESRAALDRPQLRYLPATPTLPTDLVRPPYGFPSGHVARLFFLTGLIVLAVSQKRALPIAPPVLLLVSLLLALAGLTRVTDGQHIPSEVVGGYLLAIAFLGPASALLRRDCEWAARRN
jgi:membrane-associated phospholipid phosphatase